MITGSTTLAAVIGDPVAHSLSPTIHNAAFAAAKLDWVYVALRVGQGQATEALQAMRTLGVGGLSVTMPHKAAVAAGVDRRLASVEKLGACNCVFRDGDQLVGDNTDGAGFVAAVTRSAGSDSTGSDSAGRSIELAGANVSIVGAGGAARAIIDALDRRKVARISVINRSQKSAAEAVQLSSVARVGAVSDISAADLVINATSVGMSVSSARPIEQGRDLPFDPELLRTGQLLADIVYQPLLTPLLQAAAEMGVATLGGVEMLVQQAALAFERWTGEAAPLLAMREAVADSLS